MIYDFTATFLGTFGKLILLTLYFDMVDKAIFTEGMLASKVVRSIILIFLTADRANRGILCYLAVIS